MASARFPRTCVNCQEDIKLARHVLCAVCENFHLCLACFSVGAEIGSHKSDHDYHIVDDGMFSVFQPPEEDEDGQAKALATRRSDRKEWMAWEEIRLLKAMEQYQYGNWKDVATVLQTRTAEECEEHYIECYINSNLGQKTWGTVADPSVKSPADSVVDHTIPPDVGQMVMDESDMSSLPLANILSENAIELGFLPRRQDFELEYNNNAEKLISNLQFDPTDDDLERQLKFLKVDAYYRQLVERNTRKRVALEYRLVDGFFGRPTPRTPLTAKSMQPLKKKWQARELEIGKKLKPFSRLLNAKLMEILQPCLLQEEMLRSRIQELMRYKSMGFRTFDECFAFENEQLRSTRKRSTSLSEPGPSGVSPTKMARVPVCPKTGPPSSSVKRIVNRLSIAARRQHSRNIASATSEEFSDNMEVPSQSGSESSSSFLSSDSSVPVPSLSSSMSSTSTCMMRPGPKKKKGKHKLLTRKKVCTLTRPHICPQHPAPPDYYHNA